jgi:hypothetical protein
VISPLLSNIYLNEFDRWVEDWLIPTYTRGESRRRNQADRKLDYKLRHARKTGDTQVISQLRRERRKLRALDPFDPDYRRLRFVRYADDFLLGFAGPKNEAEAIRNHIAESLEQRLKLTLSKEKTLITHAGSEGRSVIERIGVMTPRESGPTSLGCLRTRPSEPLAREAEPMTAAGCGCGLRRLPLVRPGPVSCRWGVGPTGCREGPWERLERHQPKG